LAVARLLHSGCGALRQPSQFRLWGERRWLGDRWFEPERLRLRPRFPLGCWDGNDAPPRSSRANAISGDGTAIVGWSDRTTGFRQGAQWVDGAWRWLSSDYGPVGEALGVNASGSMIVGYNCGPLGQWAWSWTAENGVQCINGPVPEPYQTYMSAVSDDGSVIGGAVRPEFGPATEAVLWLYFEPVDLQQYLLANGVSEVQSWTLSWVSAVSADGSVVAGTGIGPDLRIHGFVVYLPLDSLHELQQAARSTRPN